MEDTLDHHYRQPVQDHRSMGGVEVEGSQGPVDMKDHNMAAEEEGILQVVRWGCPRKAEDQKVP